MAPDRMDTPWGSFTELRRPLRGGPFPPQTPDHTRRDQRRRLQGAVIAAAAERGGLAAVRFEDLARLAAVSNSAVYDLYGSKQDCVAATIDRLHRAGCRAVEAAWEKEGGAGAGLRAALTTLIGLILDQPAAGRLCVVDVYEAGAEGALRVDRTLRGFERIWRGSTAAGRGRADLPPALATAIVGAIHGLVHDRLREGREAGLPELIDPLVSWSQRYRSPLEPLRRPRGVGAPPAPSPSPGSPPEPLLRGIAAAASEHGARAMTVRQIAARGHCSLSTLYAHFADKEAAFLACFEEVRARTFAAAGVAYESEMPDWPRAIAAANSAIFAYLASEPDFARVAFAEILAAGPRGLERRDETVKGFAALLAPGFRATPGLPRVTGEAMAFGVYALAHRQISRFGPEALPRIVPTATFVDLVPFLDVGRATEVANENRAVYLG
jgi:AcrR family transcriptional regulator